MFLYPILFYFFGAPTGGGVNASLNVQLAPATLSASVNTGSANATLNVQLADATAASSAHVIVSGSAAVTLNNAILTANATTTLPVNATATIQLDNAALNATVINGVPPLWQATATVKGNTGSGPVIDGLCTHVGFGIQTTIRLSVFFQTIGTNVPVDPAAVTLYLCAPDGTVTTETYPGGNVFRDDAGLYRFDLLTDADGEWNYKFQGVGPMNVTTPDANFFVQTSQFISG